MSDNRKRKKNINKTKIIESLKEKVDQLEEQKKNILSKKLNRKTKLLNQITEGKSIRNVKSCIQIINNISDKIMSTKNHKEKQLIACVVGSNDLVNNKLISSSSHKLKINRRTLKKYSFIVSQNLIEKEEI